jgi:hypothetical protein
MAAAALLYVFQLVPERQRLEAEHEGLLRAERDRAERAEQIAARERSQQEKLALELKQSRNELGETQRQLTHELQRKTPTAVRVRSGPPKQEPDCKTSGQKYDPLNPCLPR